MINALAVMELLIANLLKKICNAKLVMMKRKVLNVVNKFFTTKPNENVPVVVTVRTQFSKQPPLFAPRLTETAKVFLQNKSQNTSQKIFEKPRTAARSCSKKLQISVTAV